MKYMEEVMQKLKTGSVRDTTAKNYRAVWQIFNKFLIHLDKRPKSWEDRTALFCTHLINKGTQSQMVKSVHVSAIKGILKGVDYQWQEGGVLLSTLIKSCQLQNDHVRCRFPIGKALLELILFELERLFDTQVYLRIMYQAIFCLGYYGLMRVGELAQGDHPVKAKEHSCGQEQKQDSYNTLQLKNSHQGETTHKK